MGEEFDYPVDAEDLYDEFIEGVEEALDNIDDFDMGDAEAVMIVYVDGEGNVIGREIEVDGMKVTFLMPEKGSNFAMEYVIEVEEYDETMKFKMEGALQEDGTLKGVSANAMGKFDYDGVRAE